MVCHLLLTILASLPQEQKKGKGKGKGEKEKKLTNCTLIIQRRNNVTLL